MLLPLFRAGCLLLLLAVLPTPAPAQVRDNLRVGVARLLPNPSADVFGEVSPRFRSAGTHVLAQPPLPRQPCRAGPQARRLLLEPVLGAAVGTLLGGATFYVTNGVLAADRGAEFRRSRRNFMLAGATVGAAYGVYRVITVPTCSVR